jgi:16S rRNA (cytosine1402-N4)-methyltransferase
MSDDYAERFGGVGRLLGTAALARLRASEAEVAANPRARSAILRVAERTEVPFEAVEVAAPRAGAGARPLRAARTVRARGRR